MENVINVADCCRVCLRIDCNLTSTNSQDSDSVKIYDKLLSCVSEVSWLKEGLPSLICENCIERLRISYDFRLACLQSDSTLNRYIGHLQDDKQQISLIGRPLTTPTKFEFSIPVTTSETLPIITEENSQNAEYLHLKHFLDNDEEITKTEHLVDQSTSRSPSPESASTAFIDPENNLHQHIIIQNEHQLQTCKQSNELEFKVEESHNFHAEDCVQNAGQTLVIQTITPDQSSHVSVGSVVSINQPRQVIKRTTGVQVRAPIANNGESNSSTSKPFTCAECGKSYRKNANLRIHMRTHTGEKPFECKYCEKRFYHSSHLREHIRRHTGEKPFQCAICNKRFTIKGELTMHMKSHTGEKPYACSCCDRRCLTSADLKVHMRTHTGEKPFGCVTCGKKFASTYILNSHIKTHTGERPYSCTACDKKFTQSSHLNVHMRKHTGEKVSCKRCDATFAHSSQLTVHMREHTGKQPYRCNTCDKVCNYASELQTHVMKHTGEKFSCLTCEKKFTTAAYLHEHTRTHTGENLSTCAICDRQFTRHQYLEKHMRTHTGEKPYTCFVCNKKFTQSSSLKVHLRIHTGEKPYSCNVCDRKFTTSSDLSAHNRKHKKYISL